jgi:type III secretion system YscD/HrpQ family protein
MESGKGYIIGNDASVADIVFYDLSVSRQHARVITSHDGTCTVEDLKSRNGTIVDGKPITKTSINSQQIVSLGTTSFVVIDKEKASETIFALPPQREESREESLSKESLPSDTIAHTPSKEELHTAAVAEEKLEAKRKAHALEKSVMTSGGLILSFVILGLLALIGMGTWKLFNTHAAYVEKIDYSAEINKALAPFPNVSYTYNKGTGTLFLVGHVMTPVDKNQLLYNLQGLTFLSHVDENNVVVDQLIWQEMNNLIAKNPAWNGVNMYATAPGHFVLTGYLKTTQEGGQLTDYINRNFPYIDKLENRVVVEQDLLAKVQGGLFALGLNGVNVQVSNGELTLTGFIPVDQSAAYQNLINKWKSTPGIRVIKNFVANLAPEAAVINLSDRYKVTGYAKSDETNVNVIINGRILNRGDTLDGMTITSIQPDTIYLEKDGLKFKINYNP